MEPRIVERPAMWIAGIERRIDPMSADWDDLWRAQYEPVLPVLAPLALEDACYGVYFGTDEPAMMDLVAGQSVREGTVPPSGTVVRALPASREAVFECTITSIGQTWGLIFGQWLPSSGFEVDSASACYERFAPGCHEGTVPVTIHVPIRARA